MNFLESRTGTVALAEEKTGRRFIGAEIQKENYELALARLAQEPEPNS